MAKENVLEAIGDIARDKGIEKDRLIEVIQEAITAAAKRKFKGFEDIETRLNVKSGDIEVFRYKTVREELQDPDNEISLEEARKLDSLAEPGDEVEYEIENQELSRVIAQTARQLIFQKIREAERETIYENFKDRKGEILNGMVVRDERNRTVLVFNQTEAILYGREQIPNERFSTGEHVRVILLDVLNDPKEPSQLVISRAHPLLLSKLFEMEVPEIYDGIVEIVAAAREPGRRAKVAVISNDSDVDPVGACVGMRGSRVQAIISELRGEKIDIIKWVDDFPTYVANALAPAEISRIKIDEEAGVIDIEVDPDQLSLAIGRQGQNVRLASKLAGFKINVSSTQEQALSLEEQIRERLLASQAALGAGSAEPDAGLAGAEAAAAPEGETAPAESESLAAEPIPRDEVPGEGSTIRPSPPVEAAVDSAEAPAAEAAAVLPGQEADGTGSTEPDEGLAGAEAAAAPEGETAPAESESLAAEPIPRDEVPGEGSTIRPSPPVEAAVDSAEAPAAEADPEVATSTDAAPLESDVTHQGSTIRPSPPVEAVVDDADSPAADAITALPGPEADGANERVETGEPAQNDGEESIVAEDKSEDSAESPSGEATNETEVSR